MMEAPALSGTELERFQLFVAGLQVLADEPAGVLIAHGVVPDGVAARNFRDDPLTRFRFLDPAALAAFWRLAEQSHAGRLSGARDD